MSSTSRIKRTLVAQAHSLHPIVIIGNQGLTEGVIAETHRALYDHELIKVRINAEKAERLEIVNALCHQLGAECLKMIGHIAILYRSSDKPEKSKTQ